MLHNFVPNKVFIENSPSCENSSIMKTFKFNICPFSYVFIATLICSVVYTKYLNDVFMLMLFILTGFIFL